ncbi:MAG TPA: hypothetical protein VGF81_10490 [Solirubrobacteraceae bacterium]
MLVLDEHTAPLVRRLCELFVPGSARVWPEVYVDAVLARMPPAQRDQTVAAFEALADPAAEGPEALAEHVLEPDFMTARALACEAFYSDFVAPGAPGPGAWEEIDFKPPLAARLDKDWSFLGVS